ncbi:hypothetical protein GCM10025784_09050 [Citricoccus nitrophenolicus]
MPWNIPGGPDLGPGKRAHRTGPLPDFRPTRGVQSRPASQVRKSATWACWVVIPAMAVTRNCGSGARD